MKTLFILLLFATPLFSCEPYAGWREEIQQREALYLMSVPHTRTHSVPEGGNVLVFLVLTFSGMMVARVVFDPKPRD